MANLSFSEKKRLETFLDMGGGYVLNFSNNTLQRFVHDAIGVDIYNAKHDNGGTTSKANRIRGVWDKETDYQVGLLIEAFTKYWTEFIGGDEISDDQFKSLKACEAIAHKLKSESLGAQIQVIQATSDDINFHKLAKQVREAIERNEPETALDRLHTYTVKFVVSGQLLAIIGNQLQVVVRATDTDKAIAAAKRDAAKAFKNRLAVNSSDLLAFAVFEGDVSQG